MIIFQSEIDAGLASGALYEVTVHSTNLNANSHTIWMNFDPDAGQGYMNLRMTDERPTVHESPIKVDQLS